MLFNKRRDFIRTVIIGGAALHLPFIFSCNTENINNLQINIDGKYFHINIKLFTEIANILFPKTKIAPSASELKADIYYIWFLNDSNIKSQKRQYLASILEKIDEFSKEVFSKGFISLPKTKQKEAIELIRNTNWGENLLSSIMTIIIEAMFANQIYGSNPENIGRNWLSFKGGYPQPTLKNRYPEILELNHIQNEK